MTDFNQTVLEKNFMVLTEYGLGVGEKADHFVSACCMTSLYLEKIAGSAAFSQKISLDSMDQRCHQVPFVLGSFI